jgi:mannose-1-phosphate guanylyltransferase
MWRVGAATLADVAQEESQAVRSPVGAAHDVAGHGFAVAGAGYGPPVVVTNGAFRFILAEQLQEMGIAPAAILIEPNGRNAAPAILAACLWITKTDPDATVLVARSDHAVHDADAFLVAVKAGMGQFDRAIITFGVAAERPETGYGYMELAGSAGPIPVALTRFIEKPSADVAAALVTQHRITNPGKVAMVMIEVQTGAYLGDDDIIRYDDVYERT